MPKPVLSISCDDNSLRSNSLAGESIVGYQHKNNKSSQKKKRRRKETSAPKPYDVDQRGNLRYVKPRTEHEYIEQMKEETRNKSKSLSIAKIKQATYD